MPTIVEGILNPYDNAAFYKENISDMLDAIDRREVPFLALLGWAFEGDVTKGADSLKFECTQQEHIWLNDQLIPNFGTLGSAYSSGGGALVLGTGEGAYFVEDEQVLAISGNTTTHWRVTSINGNTLAVTLLAGATDGNHAAGTKIYAMGRPALRGEAYATSGRVTVPTSDTNYTQIFGGGKEGVVTISGTERSTAAYGITDRMAYERAKKLTELAIKMEYSCIYGLRSSAEVSVNDQPASRFGGLDYFVRALTAVLYSTNLSYNAAGARLSASENLLRNALDDSWDRGGNPSVIMMNLFNRREMSDLAVPFVRTERTERVVGIVTDTYEYTHGQINIMLNKWCDPSQVWGMTPEYIGVGPLKGNGVSRAFTVEPMPKDGDYDREAILGEYVCEIRNRSAAHFLLGNLQRAG